ncbi:MAG TPA: hypothetical protein VL860_09265 [Planctomycetota bacterium]|nr:hypothetical protein [Planctomycetota bacterium]
MSLDLNKLELKRDLADGMVQARCPACAESGGDRKGEHLRVYPDGRFGCCVHPKDGEHRKRIHALAGDKSTRTFTVRVAKAPEPVQAKSVKAVLESAVAGTLGTAMSEPVSSFPSSATSVEPELPGFGTVGTVNLQLRARAGENTPNIIEELKDSESAVLAVPPPKSALPSADQPQPKLPYLTPGGTLVIPFDSPERYHWWKPDGERLSVAAIKSETEERMNCATDF